MPCPRCGDICRCSSRATSAAPARWLSDVDARLATLPAELEAPVVDGLRSDLADGLSSDNGDGSEPKPPDSIVWREEVAARLNRYQARRKPRPPRYPSLRLRFDHADLVGAGSGLADESQASRIITTSSNQALALDGFANSATQAAEIPASASMPLQEAEAHAETTATPAPESSQNQNAALVTPPTTAKIIEFPRSWTPPLAPRDELAEPVFDPERPRILEAPEVVPPAPALGGITIQPAQKPEIEKRPGIDIPLQSAPLAQRILSAATDGVIIAGACALFGFIFWKMTAIRPPRIQIIGMAAGLTSLFWAAYQYLLVVYAGSTPGLLLARLELARFDGTRASRGLRRWRVFASFLSAASLGMGYAWVFLDEDSLCWHDRITHTYLAPKG